MYGPRERIEDEGYDALSDSELLAAIIGNGIKDHPVSQIASCAEQVVKDKGRSSIHEVADDLSAINGIGRVQATKICASIELGRRLFSSEENSKVRLLHSEDVFNQVRDLCSLTYEVVEVISLDARLNMVRRDRIGEGDVESVHLNLYKLFQSVLRENCRRFILVHNHPSGEVEPSEKDIELTDRIRMVADTMGMSMVDHIIVGHQGWHSV